MWVKFTQAGGQLAREVVSHVDGERGVLQHVGICLEKKVGEAARQVVVNYQREVHIVEIPAARLEQSQEVGGCDGGG